MVSFVFDLSIDLRVQRYKVFYNWQNIYENNGPNTLQKLSETVASTKEKHQDTTTYKINLQAIDITMLKYRKINFP